MSDLHSIGALVRSALGALGIERVDVTLTLMEEWNEIAGPPWAGVSTPVVVKGGELIVEAASATTVRFLRYSVGELLRRLDERFGEGVVATITVRPPTAG